MPAILSDLATLLSCVYIRTYTRTYLLRILLRRLPPHVLGEPPTNHLPPTDRLSRRAASLTATLSGFRGSALDPCREGLTPVAPTRISRAPPMGLVATWPPEDR